MNRNSVYPLPPPPDPQTQSGIFARLMTLTNLLASSVSFS